MPFDIFIPPFIIHCFLSVCPSFVRSSFSSIAHSPILRSINGGIIHCVKSIYLVLFVPINNCCNVPFTHCIMYTYLLPANCHYISCCHFINFYKWTRIFLFFSCSFPLSFTFASRTHIYTFVSVCCS